jgi:uncharacterized membrane protein YphA (DoxX/SURF4 family)
MLWHGVTRNKMGVYVEIPIQSAMDQLWEKTQNPDFHQRWDLRFTEIEYLPGKPEEAQRFLYRTRIGFGLRIDGEGESTGSKEGDGGARISSLRFWSEDPKSLIKVGAGYWKYVPASNAIRFLTWYDYETRFGALGKILDRCLFRPLLGWATAWSFDRLRLWIEHGIPPEVSRDRALVYSIARGAVAFIWFYHGLFPKLLQANPIELDLLRQIGMPASRLMTAVTVTGWAEIFVASLLLVLWTQKWPLWLTLIVMLVGIPVVAISAPAYVTAAFNPVTLNLGVAALSAISLIASRDLPTSGRCLRKPSQS